MSEINVARVSLFGNKSFTKYINLTIVKSTIPLTEDCKRVDEPLPFDIGLFNIMSEI